MANIRLTVGSAVYEGWDSLSFTRSMEAISGSFSLSSTMANGLSVKPGDVCKLYLNEAIVLTGYIDNVAWSLDSNNQSVTLTGRDKTSDLVDSSVTNSSGEFSAIQFKDLLETIIAPFGISVVYRSTPSSKKNKVSLNQESAFEVLDKEARKLGLFLYSDSDGSIVVDTIGSTNASNALVVGDNVAAISSFVDYSNRHNQYIVIGQQAGNDNIDPINSAEVKAIATDSNVKRNRPLVIFAETGINAEQAIDRARWEASVRAARSQEITVTVPGWTANPDLWQINTLVTLKVPQFNYVSQKLIKTITYSLDTTTGSKAELTLCNEDSFLLQPEVPDDDDNLATLTT